jgi:hypothetical protein
MNLTDRIKSVVNKFTHKSDKSIYDQADGKYDGSSETSHGSEYDFEPTKKQQSTASLDDILSDGSEVNAQNIVWDTENASLPDKSYAFDEETTDADYDSEDDLDFQDENDSGSGQESRYS